MAFTVKLEGRHAKTLCGLTYVRNPGDYVGKHRKEN